MSSKYEITFKDNILFIKLNEKLDLEGVQRLIQQLADNYDYRYRLWDLSTFNADFTLSELRHYACVGEEILTKPSAIALYSPSDRLFGEMRQYAAVRDTTNNTVLNTFRDYDQAVDWLVSQQNSPMFVD